MFFKDLSTLCGRAFAGRLVSNDPQDADMAQTQLVMHVAKCSADEIKIPFQVGDNRSRTWVISRHDGVLRLKHVHRHSDGSEDSSSQYGGDTISLGTQSRQSFPADAFSKDLFIKANIPNSANNIWSIDLEKGKLFAYELRRANRYFRVEFDLTHPIPTPPKAWGE